MAAVHRVRPLRGRPDGERQRCVCVRKGGIGVASRKDTILQFRVALRGVRPLVWRRIQVPATYSFWDLHVAIQDSMGWLDYHLHEFRVIPAPRRRSVRIGIPDDDGFVGDPVTLPGWTLPVARYLNRKGQRATYAYDFGDDWQHSLVLERVLPREPGVSYPRCIDGRRRCPPEDVGGVPGYEEFLEAVRDPEHEEHEQYLTWVGGSFDPAAFSAEAVKFANPYKRWRVAFRGDKSDE
jgi:hypothetical protein